MIGEGVVFLEFFRELPDPRQAGKVVYPLDGFLLPCLLAVLAGAETFTDIARFGTKKLELLGVSCPFGTAHPPTTISATYPSDTGTWVLGD